jgi:hypothetical protein
MARPKSRLRDWLFGAPGKRRLLEAVIADESRVWRQAELAEAAGMHKKGSADEPILALVQIGLLAKTAGRYRLQIDHPLVPPLRALLRALAEVPNDPVNRPTR